MMLLRRIAQKANYDRIRNEHIREITQQEAIIQKLENRQLNWYGHMIRMAPKRGKEKQIKEDLE